MNAVEQLCGTCIHLDKGEIKNSSRDVRSLIRQYLFSQSSSDNKSKWKNNGKQFINPWFVPSSIYIGNENGEELEVPVKNDDDIWVHIEGDLKENDPALTLGYAIYSEDGNLLFWSYYTDENERNWLKLKIGKNHLQSKIPKRYLNEGIYRIEFISSLHFRQWIHEPGKNTPVIFLPIKGGLSDSPYWMAKRPGLLAPVMYWENKT